MRLSLPLSFFPLSFFPLSFFPLSFFALALVACGGSEPSDTTDYGSEYTSGGSTASSGGSGSTATPIPRPPACADEGAGHTADSAEALALGSVAGCLGTEPDFFSVRSPRHPAGTLYEFAVAPGSTPVEVKISDAEGTELVTGEVARATSFHLVLATNSVAHLEIQGQGSASTYTLETSATPLTDDGEPNDTREEAQPLNLGRRSNALLQTAANDADSVNDFYQVLVSNAGTLNIEVEPGSDELAISVELLSSTGERVEESTAANRGATVNVSARVRRGPYFIRVFAGASVPSRAAVMGAAPRYLSEPYSVVVNVQ